MVREADDEQMSAWRAQHRSTRVSGWALLSAALFFLAALVVGYLLAHDWRDQAEQGTGLATQVQDACQSPKTRAELADAGISCSVADDVVDQAPSDIDDPEIDDPDPNDPDPIDDADPDDPDPNDPDPRNDADPDDPENQDADPDDPDAVDDLDPDDPDPNDPDPDDPENQDPEQQDPEINDPQDPPATITFTGPFGNFTCVRDEGSPPQNPTYTCTQGG